VNEREWREATDIKPATVWLVLVLAVAAGLRFWHLDHGLPYQVGIDEPQLMSRVLAMMRTGDLNPHFFDYPGLLFYVHLAIACVRFLIGAVGQEFRSLADVDVAHLLPWARAFTAVLGVGTVALVHQVGMRWGARHALLAAGLMAVLPMHVRESHYALTDVPVAFFTVLTFLLSLSASEHATLRPFLLAGVAAGLAMGTKYTAGLAILLPLVSAWMTLGARPSRLACAVAAVGAWLVTFFIVAPYTLLDLPGFLNGFAHLMTYYRAPGPDVDPAWLTYLKHVRLNLGWPASILLAAGLGLGVVRAVKGPGRVRWTLLVAFPLVFFYFVSGQGLVFARYLMPAMPFACVLAAIAVISGVSLLRRFDIPRAPRTALIVALTVAAVAPPSVKAVQFVRTIGHPSTQSLAFQWLQQHAPQGAFVVVERSELQLPAPRFRAESVRALTDRRYDEYRAAGVTYLVGTSQVFGRLAARPDAHRQEYDAYMTLLTLGREVARFTPAANRPGPELVVVEVR
jgi:4-amino-4-deoxy-L-arabinose transferase-like glycosyltransferase